MSRETLKLEADRFTTPQALAREAVALLEHSDYRIDILASDEAQLEYLCAELEGRSIMGRIRVKLKSSNGKGRENSDVTNQ